MTNWSLGSAEIHGQNDFTD